MSDNFSIDNDGNVTITIPADRWRRVVRLAGQAIHMDGCARTKWKEGNSHAALIYYDRASNGPYAKLFGMSDPALQQMLRDAAETANEGK